MKAKKVILDVDPGIDDAVAMCLALFDPRIEVVAITATGGSVPPEQATRNVQAILEQLDPPRLPRVGAAAADSEQPANNRHLFGADGLGNNNFAVAELHQKHPAEKVICDEVRAAPEEVTIVALGPLTNIARACQRDPTLPALIGQLVIMGGAVGGPGNVTPAAEFNVFCDPDSARAVFRLPITKTLVPLDVTSQVVMRFDLLDQLPSESTKAGKLLRKLLPFAFRSYRQELGLEGIYLHDAVTMAVAADPELVETHAFGCDVEVEGELTIGATIFDRRPIPQWRPNVHVATRINIAAARERITQGLALAGQQG